MENKTSIKFYLQENIQNMERLKIYMRIIVNRKKAELATSFSLTPTDWGELRQRARNNPQINQELSKLESKVYQIKSMLKLEQRPVSARIIKDLLTEKDKVNTTKMKPQNLNPNPMEQLANFFAEIPQIMKSIEEIKENQQKIMARSENSNEGEFEGFITEEKAKRVLSKEKS